MALRNRSFDFGGEPQVSGDVTQPADSKTGTFFALIRANSTSGTRYVFANSNGKGSGSSQQFTITSTAGGTFNMTGKAPDNTLLLSFVESGGASLDDWKIILASWDLANGGSRIYINDTDEGAPATEVDDVIDWTRLGFHFGQVNNSSFWKGDIQMMLLDCANFIDITSAANRRKFYDTALRIADLGDDGSTPLGAQPNFYFHAPHATGTIPANLGSAGDFELINGTIRVGPGQTSYDIALGMDD